MDPLRPDSVESRNAPAPSLRQEPPHRSPLGKILGSVGAVLLLGLKFLGKLKLAAVLALKYLPAALKTGGTMFLSIWFYALGWGWRFAVGFVVLILVHECGHLVAARQFGLKVGAPVFIPFMGAFIALKEAPRDAWMEAWVGIGGPLLGTFGACLSDVLFHLTGNPLYRALAYTGFFLNLFNLMPVGFLDGGRIVAAISPWLWLVGIVAAGAWLYFHFNLLVVLVLVLGLPRLWSLFRRKSEEEKTYFAVSPGRRLAMAVCYFGLIVFLAVAMRVTHIEVPR